MKKCGILLPVFSLPSKYGIGTFGKSAYDFVDFLYACEQTCWQVLPLTQTACGASPYQSVSVFAGNPYFIDPQILLDKGYLSPSDLAELSDNAEFVDYDTLAKERYPMLKKAYGAFCKNIPDDFGSFVADNSFWLDGYALFMSLALEFGDFDFHKWSDDCISRKNIEELSKKHRNSIDFFKFIQYEFFVQWSALRAYANERGIKIIGELTTSASPNSADVWVNPEEFISADGSPCNFSEMKKNGYNWWCERIAHANKLYDVIKIENAKELCRANGADLFRAIRSRGHNASIIADGSCDMCECDENLLRQLGLSCVRVVQYSFDGDENNPHAINNHTPSCVVYTGTQNDCTTKTFWDSLTRSERLRHVRRMPGMYKETTDRMIAYAMSSVASTVIIPMQDYLRLGDEARLNNPSSPASNWRWRLWESYNRAPITKRIKDITREFGRVAFHT